MSALVALLVAIAILAGVLAALIAGLLIAKGVREWRARRDRGRRGLLEPPILTGLHRGNGSPLPPGTFRGLVAWPLGRRARRVVETILTDHAARVGGIARDRISQAFDEFGLVDHYLARLEAGRWWVRADAAERLGIARAARATAPLALRMSDPIPEVRLRAAKALGEIGGKAAVGPLIEALARPDRWSTLRIADILGHMGTEAFEGIEAAWPSLRPASRLAALDILGRLRRPESLEFLRGLLRDGVSNERARAAHALGQLADPACIQDLVAALRDPDWPVRAMAAKALTRLAAPETAEPLAAALEDREWWVRSNAAAALKALGGRGRKALVDTLAGTDTYARHQAVLMLQESGALAEVVAQIDAEDDAARRAAEGMIRTLVLLGRTDFVGDQARDYPNPRVRARLEALLAEKKA